MPAVTLLTHLQFIIVTITFKDSSVLYLQTLLKHIEKNILFTLSFPKLKQCMYCSMIVLCAFLFSKVIIVAIIFYYMCPKGLIVNRVPVWTFLVRIWWRKGRQWTVHSARSLYKRRMAVIGYVVQSANWKFAGLQKVLAGGHWWVRLWTCICGYTI